ncbi:MULTISPECIES: hypothetical protein [unclassified Bradyrhizobium]|uniref:hypothetical protein n=1 Tax=unclassified Bradyrhizobium TaxID=2631580 RepID=UPI001FFBDC7C|nr:MULTISPECIES: hypothetical protein [unclassified Bradyrhizobium]MCK1419463.1 hypothetical protein [Bradyrhizobium sp. CW12]MCK1644664.1 hypothetical protein [Bradyrhizobium sp. 154]
MFAAHDLLLTPPAIGEAPEGLQSARDASFNQICTMLRLLRDLPAGMAPNGLLIAVQLARSKKDGARLLAAAWLDACTSPRRISLMHCICACHGRESRSFVIKKLFNPV